jgi:DeoR family fructose operon transcriptional repressor
MYYDNPSQRRLSILELVRRSGFCRTSELSEMLGVSIMTIRRDIQKLANNGLVQEVYGGVRVVQEDMGGYDFRHRLGKNQGAKKAIALCARELIDPNSIIALDAGTTVLELARVLPRDINLTVVTHSLPVMSVLSTREDIELIGLGGVFHKVTQAFTGPQTLHSVRELRVNRLFLAMVAIQNGAMYCGNPYDAEMKRELIKASDEVTLLVDSSKFHNSAGIFVAPLNDVATIIVDESYCQDSQVEASNVNLITAPRIPDRELVNDLNSTDHE